MLLPLAMAQAAPVPWKTDDYSHFSDHEPLRNVLNSLVSGEDFTVVVSDRVTDVVSLHFSHVTPQRALQRLARLYNLVWYFDGQVLYVQKADELQTATLRLRRLSPADFTRTLREMGIHDARFPWRVAERERVIHFSGPRAYVSLVMETARMLERGRRPREGAVVYRWLEPDGVTGYGSAPPEAGPYDVISLRTGAVLARGLQAGDGVATPEGGDGGRPLR